MFKEFKQTSAKPSMGQTNTEKYFLIDNLGIEK